MGTGTFHQHVIDKWVAVRTPNGTYSDTMENFLADFGQPLPELPEGAVEQIYDQGKRHCVQSYDNILAGGPIEGYAYGDQAIAAIADLMAKQRARELQKKQEQDAQFEADKAAADAELAARRAGGTT